jgi:hypothetical protein
MESVQMNIINLESSFPAVPYGSTIVEFPLKLKPLNHLVSQYK